jgi:hypothetical protein
MDAPGQLDRKEIYVSGMKNGFNRNQFYITGKERKMNRFMAFAITGLSFLIFGCASTLTPQRGSFNPDLIQTGVYEGSARNGPVKAVVHVAIENRRIARIDIVKHTTVMGGPAEEILPYEIIEKQSTDVDVVSGATMSSDAIMNAVQLAIEGAQKVE